MIYDIKKKGMMVPFKGERDVCEELAKFSKDPDASKKMKEYKISSHCPVQPVSSVWLPQVHVSV